jgi:hypothetical protein
MPRNHVKKEELKVRVLKLKNALYEGEYYDKGDVWNNGAQQAYNSILNILNEYAQ